MADSKSSSEETDPSEHINDDSTGTIRSYECGFCKRGFTTAQALGGHMNIHRKDRAKARPSSVASISSKVDDDYASFRAYSAIQRYPPHYPMSHQVDINYQTYLPPPSTCGIRSQHAQNIDDLHVQNPQQLNSYGEDWPRSLNLRMGPSHEEKREDGRKDEVDLELRLGHHRY